MKRLLIVLAMMLSLGGCAERQTVSTEPTATPSATPTAAASAETEQTRIPLREDDAAYASMNKAAECGYDIIVGGEEERILLLTDAAYENGEFFWDDSQDWALVVEAENGVYPLFESHMHGKAELSVSEEYVGSESVPVIRLSVSSSACYEIREYRFENGEFYEQIPYRAGNINEIPVETY